MTDDTRTCTKCGETKPITEFHKSKSNRGRRHIQCNTCRNRAQTQWMKDNREHWNASQVALYQRKKETRMTDDTLAQRRYEMLNAPNPESYKPRRQTIKRKPAALTPAKIKAMRNARGWSQPELAHRLMEATPEQIYLLKRYQQELRNVQNWEHGTHAPDPSNTDRLIRALTSTE
jgi:DNA-binding transcriptional regulator YiaG